MIKIKTIREIDGLAGRRVLLRADFNVPVDTQGEIKDDYKIAQGLPTIEFLSSKKCRLIIATHFDPVIRGEKKSLSVKPIALKLAGILGRKIDFAGDIAGAAALRAVKKMHDGDIIMLENLRLDAGEEANDPVFAGKLAALADIYVNDAFAVSHRPHASVAAMAGLLPSFAGLLLEKEVANLSKVLSPEEPLVLIAGGVKISTKMSLLKNFAPKAAHILVGGALANAMFASRGLPIGKSFFDAESVKLAGNLRFENIVLPVDLVTSGKKDGGSVALRKPDEVRSGECIFDIGPETIRLYAGIIKEARTIIWNGPMGMFEAERFKHGTMSIARVVASCSSGRAFGVAGGGETVEALKRTKMMEYVDWVSTGGGAMLSFLGGEPMPGLEGLCAPPR